MSSRYDTNKKKKKIHVQMNFIVMIIIKVMGEEYELWGEGYEVAW